MKRGDVFEVLEPPPHGLTRLRGKLASRRVNRVLWPALVMAVAAALVLFFIPREAPVDLRQRLVGGVFGPGSGPPVSALDGRALGLERLPSGNPQVVVYRVAVLEAGASTARD
ncbi:MAG: hypothetical protein Q8L48_39410 [Archangium sp.]|nr:hypothetical protein [Archangium sp.]